MKFYAVALLRSRGVMPARLRLIYLADRQVLFDGDVLFQGSIGRTDLPGGDYELLMRSIHDKVMTLPDETAVLSGHDPATTIGAERYSNPFLLE